MRSTAGQAGPCSPSVVVQPLRGLHEQGGCCTSGYGLHERGVDVALASTRPLLGTRFADGARRAHCGRDR